MMNGIAAAPGTGVGRVVLLRQRELPVEGTVQARGKGLAGNDEAQRFQRGVSIAQEYYRALANRLRASAGQEEAEIFEGHLEILSGEDLDEAVREALDTGDTTAEQAVLSFAADTAREFEQLDSDYFRARADDIRDIGARLAEAIHYGSIADPATLEAESVVVAEELTPSVTARLDTDRVVAIAVEKGGRTSHAAILARALEIPCVTGVEGLRSAVREGQTVVVDGTAGTVDTDVDPERDRTRLQQLTAQRERENQHRERRRRWSREHPARTADGREIRLEANVSGAAEALLAAKIGARGSGLVRSEFLFMQFSDYPDRARQAEEYRTVCRALAPDPVIVRLLDCGADKPLPYSHQKREDNPFLGERGIRFLMNRPEVLREQVRAITDVAREGLPIKLMIPMVISREEIRTVRELAGDSLPVGIMVETPASVLAIPHLAREADFVSIGTNDLVQYILAVDRGNAAVAHLSQEFHPAVLTAIDRVVHESHAVSIPVGVCGDMASRPETALALLALGVDELSSGISSIPEIKAALATITGKQLEQLGTTLRSSEDPDHARRAAETLSACEAVPWQP